MHWLGLLHAARLGDSGDGDALALMWVAKAAAHGHAIAAQQVAALLPDARLRNQTIKNSSCQRLVDKGWSRISSDFL